MKNKEVVEHELDTGVVVRVTKDYTKDAFVIELIDNSRPNLPVKRELVLSNLEFVTLKDIVEKFGITVINTPYTKMENPLYGEWIMESTSNSPFTKFNEQC